MQVALVQLVIKFIPISKIWHNVTRWLKSGAWVWKHVLNGTVLSTVKKTKITDTGMIT